MNVFPRMAVALILISLSGRALANPIFIANHSFETPKTVHIDGFQSWTGIGGTAGNPAVYNPYEFNAPNAYYIGATPASDPANGGSGYVGIDGENLAFAFERPAGTGFQQMLGAVFKPDTAYTLTIAEGRRNGVQAAPTLGSLIELLAGNTVVASSIDNVGPALGTFKDQIAFLASSNSFSNLFGEALTIRVLTTLPFLTPYQASDWDNVRLDATGPSTVVPEPTSLMLLVLGVILMISYGWTKRQPHVQAVPSLRFAHRKPQLKKESTMLRKMMMGVHAPHY